MSNQMGGTVGQYNPPNAAYAGPSPNSRNEGGQMRTLERHVVELQCVKGRLEAATSQLTQVLLRMRGPVPTAQPNDKIQTDAPTPPWNNGAINVLENDIRNLQDRMSSQLSELEEHV